MRTYKEACNVLGISENADKETVKKAYHKLALKHHPDKGGDADIFREVSEAYKILTEHGESGLQEDEDWDNFDPMMFFKEQFSQNDMFVMVQDYGLFDNLLESTDLFGTLFSNLGGIMMDQDKIFNLANTFLGDESAILFNTLKSTHDFAKDIGSKIKDASTNVSARLKDVYEGRVVRVKLKRRRFDGESVLEDIKKVAITLRYQKFKLPNEGHQMAPGSKVYGDAVFDVRIKDYLETVYRFNQDDIFVEASVGKSEEELFLEWANLKIDLSLWKQETAKILMLKDYGFYKNEQDERGIMYIHIVYDENIVVPKLKERASDDEINDEHAKSEEIIQNNILRNYTLIPFKNLLL